MQIMKKAMKTIEELQLRATELTNLNNIMALLQWDQEVMMPAAATKDRACQFSTLSTIIHKRVTDPALGNLLQKAAEHASYLANKDNALVRILTREYSRNTKLPEQFVADFVRLTSESLPAWIAARKQADFKLFLPFLKRIVSMTRQKAEYLEYVEHPYDALLDLYEEGLTSRSLTDIFVNLQPELTSLVQQKRSTPSVEEPDFPFPPIAEKEQVAFSEKLLAEIGYDFTRGRQDVSPHPFTTSIGHNDRRVTNRYRPDSLEFIFCALHEGGHTLYEQGIGHEYASSPLDEGVSLGMHESQSRLWENIIGRSRLFWSHYFPLLQRCIPDPFQDVDIDTFVRYINRIQPGFIRVEADEVSYNLHIIVRFELEKELLAGNIRVEELPALWNEKYRDYLGLTVDSDANGVLQDIHWAHGSIGYFPTYTIGNLVSAQIWQSYCNFDPDYRQTLQQGQLGKIRQWLTDNIYCHGALFPPAELLQRVSSEPLHSSYFVDYLKNKSEFCQ
jgi:carboxypeptidase Taq